MSDGIQEEIRDDTVDNSVMEPAEVLQESQEYEAASDNVVNCIKINFSERNSYQDEGEYSGQSSAAATPLERSQEISHLHGSSTSSPVNSPVSKDLQLFKEWSSFIHLLARIPVKAQKGLSTFDLKLTCISTISEEILVIGTNVGIVYWYNRRTDALDRLRCDGINSITSLSCISTVDYMIAAGNQTGLVTIFQIPRDLPPDHSNVSPEVQFEFEKKVKKSQRFLIQDLHKGAVTALEWSKNGMKLFSGDQTGHVVITDIDYDLVQIRSSILLCENYEIVQLSYTRKNLLICSTFRSIIYSLENKDFNKVGSLERKTPGKFGGLIVSSAWEESPKVYSVRPGARLWVANLAGVVQHTIKFKELLLSGCSPEVHVIKPPKTVRQLQADSVQFSRVFRFMKDYLVTYYKDVLYIVDARNTVVLGTCKELRSILDVAVNKNEIFILESPRTVIRLSANPDKFSSANSFSNSGSFSAYLAGSPTLSSTGGGGSPFLHHDSSSAHADFSAGIKQLPDIMSASIADFRFPQEPINFLTSKLKRTSEKVIPKINPIINTIKTVIEADVDIEDGQKLLETGLPPVIPLEATEISELFSPSPVPPEEPVFVPEPERFQKISTLPFEDVVVDSKPVKKTKKSHHGRTQTTSKKGTSSCSDVASDSVSVSSAYSNTSGSDNNVGTGGGFGATAAVSSSASSTSAGKLSFVSDATVSSSNSGSEGVSSAAPQKDKLGIPIALSQSWSVGTLIPNKIVSTEELHLKEEMLARRLKWPELLPESVPPDSFFDDHLSSTGTLLAGTASPETNNCWQVNLPKNYTNNKSDKINISPVVGGDGSTGDDNTDTDSKTISLENGSSIGTVIERPSSRGENDVNGLGEKSAQKNQRDPYSSDVGEEEEDEDEDKYYTDIYTRFRSRDSGGSYNSVLSFGPPSGSSYVNAGSAILGGVSNINHINGNGDSVPRESTERPSSTNMEQEQSGKDIDVSSPSLTPEEVDSIVESKVVSDESWRKWRLPGSITQVTACDHYIICVGSKGAVYYAGLHGVTIHWRTTNYSASSMSVSPCGTVIWRIYRNDLYSLTNPIEGGGPVGEDSEQWSKLTQKRDVASASVQRSFGWIVKCDGSLEFCTGLLETRLVPYFEKVYTPWPIQEVSSCGHRLWALTSDGRIVLRTGTSNHNPKGVDWLELKWTSSDIPPACSISSGEIREDGVASVWFADANANLYFTFDERDVKGMWVAWKVPVANCVIYPSSNQQQKTMILTSIKDQVSRSIKSLVHQGSRTGLKLCTSKKSLWLVASEASLMYSNRNSVTGHHWKPLRVDHGITVPSSWNYLYANSIYQGHGNLWISDSKGRLFYVPPSGGNMQQIDLPVLSEGQIVNVAPAPESLWVLTSTGDIHGRCGITSTDCTGNEWRQINLSMLRSTHFVHLSCGSEVAWAVDGQGEVYMRIGSLRPPGAQDMSPAWNKVEKSACCKGIFKKVYVGANDRTVWALDDGNRVYVRQGVFPDYPIGTGWLMVKGVDATILSISDSAVWALSVKGEIYRRYGVTENNYVGDYWRKIPGVVSAITVSLCDELWALTSEGYLLKHSKKIVELQGWGNKNANLFSSSEKGSSFTKIVLDEEDEDWELVDNSEI